MLPFLKIPVGLGLGLSVAALGLIWALWCARGAKREPGAQRNLGPTWIAVALGLTLALVAGIRGEPLTVVTWPTYGLTMLVGSCAAIRLGMHWAEQRGLRPELIVELGLLALVFGVIGARAVHIVEQWETTYADRPPALASPGLLQPLAPGDTLEVATTRGRAVIRFSGAESSAAELAEAIERQGEAAGLKVKLLTSSHRRDDGVSAREGEGEPGGVLTHPRGLLLSTRARGEGATLEVRGGSAAPKLGLPPVRTQGLRVPWWRMLDLSAGGLTYFGSIFGVLGSCLLWLRHRRVRALVVLDLMAPTLPLGLFFGRLGCLAYGCCWGRATSSSFGLSFPPGSLPWQQFARGQTTCAADPVLAGLHQVAAQGRVGHYDALVDRLAHSDPILEAPARALAPRFEGLLEGTPLLHPAQLYEGLGVLLIFGLLWAYRAHLQRRLGQCFALLFLLQAPLRFVVEHFRRDHDVFFRLPGLSYDFTESQLVALGLFALALPAFAWLSLRGASLNPSSAEDSDASSTAS